MVVSPSTRPSAISRSKRRMILALRVLGSSEVKKMSSGRAMAPIFGDDVLFQFVLQRIGRRNTPSFSVTNAEMPCPFTSCVLPITAASATEGVIHQRAFDFIGGDAVPGDVHHVVHAAQQPEIAVVVHLAAVAGEIHARIARPVLLHVAIGIAINRAHHRRPGLLQHQIAARARANASCPRRPPLRPRCREKAASPNPAWLRVIPGSGVIMHMPVSVCHQVSTIGQRRLPMYSWYQIQASGLIGSPTVPISRKVLQASAAPAIPCPSA